MAPGDLVWIYESQSGKAIVQESADGGRRFLRRRIGRGGVVTLAEVVEPPGEDLASTEEQYDDGTKAWWQWKATTRIVDSVGFIPREDLNDVLSYKRNNPLRGFGTENSGLMEITPAQHLVLQSAFLASHEEQDAIRLRTGSSIRGRGVGGEGPVHLALKNAIALDPAGCLGEDGLSLIQMEFPFGATGDRIDVLLRDRLNRFVAVEVEPECPASHIAGPLQCMKYRSMLAYLLERDVTEVRALLVTHELSAEVRARSTRYEIECLLVPRLDEVYAEHASCS
jgi:hypothetical protein